MAWRIHDKISHGEIDNRIRGVVEGRLWTVGSDEPIRLELKGNCWSDLAGCLLTFRNPRPERDGAFALHPEQQGVVGDMTASRKVRVPTVSDEEVSRLIEEREPIPTKLGNCVYLEWYSSANGRVVLEAAHYQCEISPREWTMTPEQEEDQRRENQESLQDFLQNVVNQQSLLDLADETEEEEPLDEFQWERLLRQSDKITDQYLDALEKYRDDPDCDRLVAQEMGWDWLIEEGDLPRENPIFDFIKQVTGDVPIAEDDDFPLEDEHPEGFDEDEHPVSRRARQIASRVFDTMEERRLWKNPDAALVSLMTCSIAAAAKVSGALGSVGNELDEPDYGFVIATLKRSLTPLHQAIAAAERLTSLEPEEADWVAEVREELFLIREDVLSLMQDFRRNF